MRIVIINKTGNVVIAKGQHNGDEITFDTPVQLESGISYAIRSAHPDEQVGAISTYEEFLDQKRRWERERGWDMVSVLCKKPG